MMLTGGIEFADGKSNLADPGVAAAGGADDNVGVRKLAPVVACSDGSDGAAAGAMEACEFAPEPFAGQASACAPIEASNKWDFMLATTRAGSRNNRSSAQSAPLQPRVIRT
jgi:hypothetical protein